MLHCGQLVECKYSIVGCISVYSNGVFFECEKCAILLSAGITLQWVGILVQFSAKGSIIL